jgi:hypothetical protein
MVAKKSVFKVVANGFFDLKNGKKWFALARSPMNTKNKTVIVVLLLVFSGNLARANHFLPFLRSKKPFATTLKTVSPDWEVQ